ncbi:Gfo/Idh/MocA family protein [Alkaliphilus peptidifermentans]|uniref:UDP-N-acetyl-2-amino-2-deoxyglucuronate dehydrogenase n=1 Tax=Alkaliphilus peptidifermentans DSM 18978 TaxID=1120976 RepID=A0A1G5H131_9FIRM|nr:Gfo/Idh/MocA family oxidoreductase [Alkaliphilus peptidifermentans]SCY57562.1 UDP-N-acetyl-2-amino-2-deoxyglucuronate dehydrogenase [Alkaliphilus peptidifermentans DSM 18978]
MKIGLVGCGRISKTHLEAIKKLSNANIAGCCDIVEDRAKSTAEKYNIPYWTTKYQELLKEKDIDLISICTPSGLHPEHGIMAANHGKHVLTEKPMGVRLIDADKLITACEENGVKLFVVLQNRLNPSIQMVKNAIDKGRFGKVFMIVANVFWTRPQEYYDLAAWRGTWALDGGAFCNQASHYVDLVQWFGGPVKSVMASTATLARDIEAEDTGAAIINFHSGCIATINVTMLTYPKNLEGSITIIGEKGTVRVGGIAVNEILHWQFQDYDEVDRIVNNVSTIPDSVYGFGHMAYYQNVINSIINGENPLIDGLAGRKSLELIESIYLSNRQQRVVIL